MCLWTLDNHTTFLAQPTWMGRAQDIFGRLPRSTRSSVDDLQVVYKWSVFKCFQHR